MNLRHAGRGKARQNKLLNFRVSGAALFSEEAVYSKSLKKAGYAAGFFLQSDRAYVIIALIFM